jgi:hypothetical protein
MGLCVVPDHVVARRLDPLKPRCVITAWDGPSTVPPTAKTTYTDDAPAHPGVFFSIEVPSFRAATPYTIKSDPMSTSGAQVLVVRVDPAVKFADRRIVESGDVTVIAQGDDVLVVIHAGNETATLTIEKANNACGKPIEI